MCKLKIKSGNYIEFPVILKRFVTNFYFWFCTGRKQLFVKGLMGVIPSLSLYNRQKPDIKDIIPLKLASQKTQKISYCIHVIYLTVVMARAITVLI